MNSVQSSVGGGAVTTAPVGRRRLDPDRTAAVDAAHVWHPYSAFPPTESPLVVDGARGTRLHLADGRTLVDGMSSWWAAIHGYRHPVLDDAVRAQLDRMSHVMFGGLTHEPAARLAELLVGITPDGLDTVFLADSGSVSIEVAVKMALQYQRARGRPGRTRLATWRGGYHGDTLSPMSVCDPDGGMHRLWTSILPRQVFAPPPPTVFDPGYVDEWDALLGRHADEIAAVVIEPVVQGAGGMRFHDPRYVAELRRLCDERDILLVADEIATGFGRTGALFAVDHAGVSPDLLCVGKALTGGYLTAAAVLASRRVAETISAGEGGAVMHGPTFMGNPLACAVAIASTELLLSRDWRGEVADIEAGLRSALAPATGMPGVREVRVLGAIGVVQCDRPVDVAIATRAAVDAGVWLRPFRDLVYTMPPFVSTADDVARIGAGVMAAVAAVAPA